MFSSKKVLFFLFAFLGMVSAGCQYLEKEKMPKQKAEEGYYSISGFLNDQWDFLGGKPIVLLRVASFNGHTDSSFVHLDSVLWKNIRKQFDPADISDSRFLNQYDFSVFNEDALSLIYLDYEAQDKALFTQKLNVGIDNLNYKIRSIFIETHEGNRTYEKSQKLTYIPHKIIQIQAFEKSVVSRPEELKVSYYFKY